MQPTKQRIPLLVSLTLTGLAASAAAWWSRHPTPQIPNCVTKFGNHSVT